MDRFPQNLSLMASPSTPFPVVGLLPMALPACAGACAHVVALLHLVAEAMTDVGLRGLWGNSHYSDIWLWDVKGQK